jgi:hypothetical protein
LANQFLIPGVGFIDGSGADGLEFLIPGAGFINIAGETTPPTAGHRYWRILSRRGNIIGEPYIGAGEIEFHDSKGGPNLCSGGTYIESGHYGALTGSRAFDDDNATDWAVINTPGCWIGYDFGVGNTFDIIEIKWVSRSFTYDSPVDFALQYSDDATIWYDKINWFNQPAWTTNGEERTFNDEDSDIVVGTQHAPKNMTTNSLPTPFVASAESTYSTYYPCLAFDGSYAEFPYVPAYQDFDGYLKIDLGVGNEVNATHCVIVHGNGYATGGIKDFTIEGSTDDNEWDTLCSPASQTNWTSYQARIFSLIGGQDYRYYRIVFTTNNGAADFTRIWEVFFFKEIDIVDYSVITLKYRTGATAELCAAADYIEYTGEFDSEGYVQLRVEG